MSIAWSDVGTALALLFVFEGMLPFSAPHRWRSWMQLIAEQSDSALRTMGLVSMLIGAVLLWLVR